LASENIAILLISSELPEILALSNRIVTMHHGRITGQFSAEEASEDVLLRAAMGKGLETGKSVLEEHGQ
jgi:ribose transport system ATP-binding protein